MAWAVLMLLAMTGVGNAQPEPRGGEYFTPFHMADYTEWAMKNVKYHASLFPHTFLNSLTYAFKKSDAPNGCLSMPAPHFNLVPRNSCSRILPDTVEFFSRTMPFFLHNT